MSFRGVFAAAAVVAAAVLAAVPGPPGLSAAWTGWLNGGLERYADAAVAGNGGGHWNSGGSPVIVALPGGRALWLVPDSYTGPVNGDGTVNPARSRYTPNALLVTQGSGASFRVLSSVSRGLPVAGAPAGGVVSGNAVLALYTVFAQPGVTPSGTPSGTDIVRMPLASLTRPSTFTVSPVPSAGIQWESVLAPSACPGLSRCVYLYGARSGHLVEAVAAPSLSGRWRYTAVSGVPAGSGLSVYQVSDGSYVALTGSGAGVTAYYASTPALSDAVPAALFAAPAVPGVPGALAYRFRIESAYSRGPDVVMGFAVNSADHDRACLNYAPFYDVGAYQPEFYSFTLPPSAGAAVTGTLPSPRSRSFARSPVAGERWSSGSCSAGVPVPLGFRARYGGSGRVNLSWSDPGGLYSYDLRVSDAGDPGAGWRELKYPVWDSGCGGPGSGVRDCAADTASSEFLAPGHTYRYEISAWNWTGRRSARTRAPVTLPARITAVTSGLCDTGTVLGSCADGPGWRYVPVAKGEYALSPVGSGRCLVPSGHSVVLGSCSAVARGWKFRITDGAFDFNLYSQATGRCLAVSGGARLVLAPCAPSPDSIWHSSPAP